MKKAIAIILISLAVFSAQAQDKQLKTMDEICTYISNLEQAKYSITDSAKLSKFHNQPKAGDDILFVHHTTIARCSNKEKKKLYKAIKNIEHEYGVIFDKKVNGKRMLILRRKENERLYELVCYSEKDSHLIRFQGKTPMSGTTKLMYMTYQTSISNPEIPTPPVFFDQHNEIDIIELKAK